MNKIAFVFPGQGAQYAGMGQDFYEKMPVCKAVFDCSAQVTGLDLPELCFTENSRLNITEYTQIAMLTVSAAILKAVEETGLSSCVNAGLSLGEYGALVASKALTLEDAFALVRKRGIFMQEAVPFGGAMAAVMGLDGDAIAKICDAVTGTVSVANYNCPGQIVITGEAAAVETAGVKLKEAGARRIVPLKVSGPFHSKLLAGAGERLREELKKAEIYPIETPYVTNVTAEYVEDSGCVKDLLVRQVSSSVRWQQSVEKMIAGGVDTFVEIGPGKTLSGFIRKISGDVTVMNIQNTEDFQKVMDHLA